MFQEHDANGVVTAEKSPKENSESPRRAGKTPKNPKSPETAKKASPGQKTEYIDNSLGMFSNKIKNLPEPVKESMSQYAKPRKKSLLNQYYRMMDMALITIISVISGALPNYRFYYRGSWYYAPLMTIVVANPGAGKSIMDAIFEIIAPIHAKFRNLYEELVNACKDQQKRFKMMTAKERKACDEEELEMPDHLLFRIPADSTYASFMKMLAVMKGVGELLDTEIDTVLNAFKSDLGNYSVFIRKNFKHEAHSYSRKTENEYREIAEPKFAMVLSGTLSQMENFINEVLSGLFSRFCIYWNQSKTEWIDEEYYDDEVPMDEKSFFRNFGKKLFALYTVLERRAESPIRFRLTSKQLDKFNNTFRTMHNQMTSLEGDSIHASVVRIAVVFHRIAMVLTISHHIGKCEEEIEAALGNELFCSNQDFNTAMTICLALMEHAAAYFEHITKVNEEQFCEDTDMECQIGNEKVYEAVCSLPIGKSLTTTQILDKMIEAGVPKSTASKNLRRLCRKFILKKEKHGVYKRVSPQEYMLMKEGAKKSKVSKKSKKTKSDAADK